MTGTEESNLAEPNLIITIHDDTGRIIGFEEGYGFYLPPWHPPCLRERLGHFIAAVVAFARECGIMTPIVVLLVGISGAILLFFFAVVMTYEFGLGPLVDGYRSYPAQAGTEVERDQ
jgi:hypothetical protein